MQAILFVLGVLLLILGTALSGLGLIVDPRKDYGRGRVLMFGIGAPALCGGVLLLLAATRL